MRKKELSLSFRVKNDKLTRVLQLSVSFWKENSKVMKLKQLTLSLESENVLLERMRITECDILRIKCRAQGGKTSRVNILSGRISQPNNRRLVSEHFLHRNVVLGESKRYDWTLFKMKCRPQIKNHS